MDTDAFVVCVQSSDIQSLTRIPGIGKKTAERLVIEMRDRVADWSMGTMLPNMPASVTQEAISALVGLGYKPQEASRAIAKVQEENLSSEELIRNALRSMVSG